MKPKKLIYKEFNLDGKRPGYVECVIVFCGDLEMFQIIQYRNDTSIFTHTEMPELYYVVRHKFISDICFNSVVVEDERFDTHIKSEWPSLEEAKTKCEELYLNILKSLTD
jgi:hypothetical protein